MNKKLAIINHNLGSGGAEKLIYDMALEFKKRNLDFSVILLTSIGDIYGKKLEEAGIDVIYLSDKWDIYSPKNIFRLKKILKDYDVVHTHTYTAQLWTAFASLFLDKKKKYITTEHSTHNRRREKKYFKYIDKWMYSRYNKIVSITEATQNNLKKWLGDKKESKYFIINNGINLDNYFNTKPIDRKLIDKNISQNDILISMIGRFSEQKDQETLIKSMQFLNEIYKLILLGDGDSTKEKKIVQELNLENRVYFLGYKSNIAEIVKSCDIAVLSSYWEGLPLALLESMALGVPTLGSNVQGIKDIIGDDGVVFERGNSKELAEKIEYYINNKDEYEKLSKLGIEKSKRYSLEEMVEKYLKTYEEKL